MILLLTGMFALVVNIKPTWAIGTIYIRANGAVEGTSYIQTADNITYVFVADINDSIIIERNDLVLDGNAHKLQGAGIGNGIGIDLTGRLNVTVQNMQITSFATGIWLYSSSNNDICRNSITNNWNGIELGASSNNSICGNNITDNDYAVQLISNPPFLSNFNNISGNKITSNMGTGVWLEYSQDNYISENNITDNLEHGLWFDVSSNNTLTKNNITANSEVGVYLYGSSYNNVSANDVTDNLVGINAVPSELAVSSNNDIRGNNITANGLYGICLDYSSGNLICHNNFVANNEQIHIYTSETNIWDDGYPSGGNYWSDYNGTDVYKGHLQNISGSDGIGDTSHIIDSNNTDRYPLAYQSGWLNTTQLMFALTPNPDYVGQTVTLLGNLTNNLGQPINNTKIYLYVNGTSAGNLSTNSSGGFQASSKVPTAGTYNITAYYYGSQDNRPSVHAETLIVYTPKLNTKVSFTLSPSPAKVGQTVTMLGNLTDAQNNTIASAPLEVYLKVGAGSWQYKTTIYTNSTGWFNVAGRVTSSGTYQIAVLYTGSYKHNQSYKTQALIVNP